MAEVLTIAFLLALGGYLSCHYTEKLLARHAIHVTIRLDRATPGAHLIWDTSTTDRGRSR